MVLNFFFSYLHFLFLCNAFVIKITVRTYHCFKLLTIKSCTSVFLLCDSNLIFSNSSFPSGSDRKECLKCRTPRFKPWVGKMHWRKKWQPTPVFLPGESHGQRGLAGCSLWGRKELDTTEQLTVQFQRANTLLTSRAGSDSDFP